MFIVSKADAAAIRAAFEQGGELSASVELRRLFPGLANNENTRICARTIAGWTPIATDAAEAAAGGQDAARASLRAKGAASQIRV